MGMTLTEKILAKVSGNETVVPGQFVNANVSTIGTMDLLGKIVLDAFGKLDLTRIPDPEKFVICFDHQVPANEVKFANVQKSIRELAESYGVKYFYDVGCGGILHQVLPEKGHVLPGTVCVATESHSPTGGALGAVMVGVGQTEAAMALATGTVWLRVPQTIKVELTGKLQPGVATKDLALVLMKELGFEKKAVYHAVEFGGEGVATLSMASRLTLSNMVADMGAKNGIFPADDVTLEFLKGRTDKAVEKIGPDPDAKYEMVLKYNLDEITPQVDCPPDMENVYPVSEIEKTAINQAVIGSCTNGRLEDIEIAAKILSGKHIAKNVRLVVLPASQEIYKAAMASGAFAALIDAGAMICPPSCGPCHGGHLGLLADNEAVISSTNRNWVGRMGSKAAKVYLGSPATVAASALEGYIVDPRKYV